jgi:hypothetical protein
MKSVLVYGVLAALLLAAVETQSGAADSEGDPIGHMVYFTLKDKSPAKVKELVAACDKYLTKHPGEVFYGAGTLAREFDRPVNDRDWDVALHIVFKSKADHDRYQDAPRHKQFIEENRENWKKVRVFDSLLKSR